MIYRINQSTETEVYFLSEYKSRSKKLAVGDYSEDPAYGFKMYNHHKEEFEDILKCLKNYFGIGTTVGVPSSTPKINNVQKICDSHIRFIPKYKRTKKRKEGSLDDEYKRVEVKVNKAVKSAILVDDICTTGETLMIYNRWLRSVINGPVISFAFGHKETEKRLEFMLMIKRKDFMTDLLKNF